MTVAYVRVSTDKQDLENQRFEIQRFCSAKQLQVDEWVEEVVSGSRDFSERKIGELLASLQRGDRLVVSEVSRISRRLLTIMRTLEDCLHNGVTIMTVKEGYVFADDINSQVMAFAFGLAAEIERRLISARTKEALARRRAEGVVLGRPKGSSKPEHYKLHGKDEQILKYMDKRVPLATMARLLDVNRKTLRSYIERQNLSEEHRWRRFKQTGV